MARNSNYAIAIALISIASCCANALPKNSEKRITSCGGVIEGTSGTIDYLFPEGENYGFNEFCLWTIRTNPPTQQIELTKEQSFLEVGYDYITAVGIPAHRGELQTEIIGKTTNAPETVVLNGSVAIVNFASDSAVPDRGFRMHFRAVGEPESRVNNYVDFSTGTVPGALSYPEAGGYYHSYELSTFLISRNYTWTGTPYLELNITDVNMENSVACEYDGLALYRITRGIFQQAGRYCGTSNTTVTHNHDTAYLFVLYSDDSNVGRGFNVTWGYE